MQVADIAWVHLLRHQTTQEDCMPMVLQSSKLNANANGARRAPVKRTLVDNSNQSTACRNGSWSWQPAHLESKGGVLKLVLALKCPVAAREMEVQGASL